METQNQVLNIEFQHAKKQVEVPVENLTRGVVQFLDIYGNTQFCGQKFAALIGQGSGENRFASLLNACGYENDPRGFFEQILGTIARGDGWALAVNGVRLPAVLLADMLEQVLPGHGYKSVRDTGQLVTLTNLEIPESDEAALQEVIEKYPVRISAHTIRQMMVSRDVAYQYLPFVEELNSVGHTNTWIGQFHDGLLEQMYQNRVIFLLNMSCPVYCRFCFRKHKDSRNEKNPTPEDVMKAVDHVKNSPGIKEIVVTGGDPFMNRKNMAATIDGLMAVDHVQSLRLATRSVAYYPDLFLEKECEYLKYLKQKSFELQRHGKRMEVATHFIHPDEISPESLEIITDLVNAGIAVYIQTPFLSGCNDEGPELVTLFSRLRGAGAEMHYIYIPCSPIHGNSIYWKSLADGIDTALHLRAHLSDRAIPRICTATPIGKMDWFSSGWAVERVGENDNFIWIRTPYTPGYFKAFAPLANELSNIRINEEGTIDIQYMAKIGNDDYLIGNRPGKSAAKNAEASPIEIKEIEQELADVCQTACSVVNTGLDSLARLHETRVLINETATKEEFSYIRADHRITDVVLTCDRDPVTCLSSIRNIMKELDAIDHVNTLRLRSMTFALSPEKFTRMAVNTLGEMNRLCVVEPLRLEIETWFVRSQDITEAHAKLARRLNNLGISVYANVPLLGGINDTDNAIHDLAYALRNAGIEFHHLYVAGLPVQARWNEARPIDSFDVTSIATMVRREGSGREIPRYIIATELGEVDYGLTSRFVTTGDTVEIALACYDEDYYKAMDEQFVFPDGVRIQEEGHPVVNVPGLIKTNDFPVS